MIEVNDLRIRNILLYKDKYHYVSSLSLDIDDEYEDLIGIVESGKNTNEICQWNRSYGEDLIAAPITEAILKKAGFSGLNFWHKKGFFWRINIRGPKFYMVMDEDDIANWIELQYVHQLQNLYYALTNEELVINF